MTHSRRAFMRHGIAGGVGLLTFLVAGCEKKLTPAEARAADVPLRTFDRTQAAIVEALGEGLLPGSAAAGLAHYIDHQLSGPQSESMLMIKYLGVEPPFTDFYRAGLAGSEAAARQRFGKSVAALSAADLRAFLGSMSKGDLPGWNGPPPPFFFFVLRSDAVDTYYGTQEGFERLGVPYMPHIPPATRWGS